MKKVFMFIALMMLYGICMAKPRIISSEPCEYRDVSCDRFGYQSWFKEEISYNQALEDLDMLIYLLKSSYAGYDDAVKRGLEIDNIIESFKKSNDDGKNIKVSDLSQFICDFLKPYIQDFHFYIESKDFSKHLITQHRVLYSNIYVKKINDSFVIEKSDKQDFQVGENLECKIENLFLYPSEGKNIYRIGSYATIDENEKQISVICSGNEKQLLCDIANDYLTSNDITTYKEIETENSVYIYIPILMDLQNNDNRKTVLDENFEKLHSVSSRYPEKKNIILDLRTNGGGNSLHTSSFLANLYFLEKNCNEVKSLKNIQKEWNLIGSNGDKIDLISPPVQQAENWLSKYVFSQDKYWKNEFAKRKKILNNKNLRITYTEQKKIKPKSGSPKFKGNLIILSGKNTCSSSELAIFEARNIFSKTNQFFQIGENTAGCFGYGNVWCYQLINSGITLHLASYIHPYAAKCPEGWGVAPDYWATNDDLVKAIVNVTGDQELSEKLKDINKDL